MIYIPGNIKQTIALISKYSITYTSRCISFELKEKKVTTEEHKTFLSSSPPTASLHGKLVRDG